MLGTCEEKLRVLQHQGLPRRPLLFASWALSDSTKTDKKGLAAEVQTECLMQLIHIS